MYLGNRVFKVLGALININRVGAKTMQTLINQLLNRLIAAINAHLRYKRTRLQLKGMF